jgi:hypothetical protein
VIDPARRATVEAMKAALQHARLLPAAEVRRLIAQAPPTGAALRWRRREVWARRRVAQMRGRVIGAIERSGRRSVECPICSWRGYRFRPDVRGRRIDVGVRCPRCRAVERHRLFVRVWATIARGDGRCLHFAPEPWLAPLVAASGLEVTTIDIADPTAMVRADAEQLPFTAGRFAVVISNDVLEHVADDGQALRELRRVLADDGVALLHTPIVATETVEYGFANALDHGHRRAYGPDLLDRIDDAGFSIELARTAHLDARGQASLGLHRDDVVLVLRPAGLH